MIKAKGEQKKHLEYIEAYAALEAEQELNSSKAITCAALSLYGSSDAKYLNRIKRHYDGACGYVQGGYIKIK